MLSSANCLELGNVSNWLTAHWCFTDQSSRQVHSQRTDQELASLLAPHTHLELSFPEGSALSVKQSSSALCPVARHGWHPSWIVLFWTPHHLYTIGLVVHNRCVGVTAVHELLIVPPPVHLLHPPEAWFSLLLKWQWRKHIWRSVVKSQKDNAGKVLIPWLWRKCLVSVTILLLSYKAAFAWLWAETGLPVNWIGLASAAGSHVEASNSSPINPSDV